MNTSAGRRQTGRTNQSRKISRKISNRTPPHTTKTITPRAHVPSGDRFFMSSCREGLVGFLPERAALANWAFFWRRSCAVGMVGTWALGVIVFVVCGGVLFEILRLIFLD